MQRSCCISTERFGHVEHVCAETAVLPKMDERYTAVGVDSSCGSALLAKEDGEQVVGVYLEDER